MFGYFAAVAAGFLLTAVPNWTGRCPIVGSPLVALFALWLTGRVAITFSASLLPLAVALMDISFLVALIVFIGREIIAGRNWRNGPILFLLSTLIVANGLFHWEMAHGGFPAQGSGARLGISVSVMLIGLMGGRIVPVYTRNWLAKRPNGRMPAPPMGRYDRISPLTLGAATACWVV